MKSDTTQKGIKIMVDHLVVEKKVFDEKIEEWRTDHLGEFVLIKDGKVVGFFLDLQDASNKGFDLFGLDDFFIERIHPPESVNVSFLGHRI